jgi:hypothetical protein
MLLNMMFKSKFKIEEGEEEHLIQIIHAVDCQINSMVNF